jgi:HlyD family secretion protein
MDKQIQPKNKKLKTLLLVGGVVALLIIITAFNLTRKKSTTISRDAVAISEVTRGQFEDVVLFNSIVAPKTSVLINVVQGGAVAEIFAESGQIIKSGDPMLKVYNPTAELNYLTQETAIVEQINSLRNIRVNIKNQQLILTEQLLSIDNSYKNAHRKFRVDSTLFAKDVIAKNEYESTQQEYTFQGERNVAIKESVKREKTDRNIQMSRINTSIATMQKSLELLEKNKENFILKAPIGGVLSSFNPILGENYDQGESVGKIDMMDGYKLVAKVDEYYISKLREGVKGMVTTNGATYEVSLDKVFPEVVNGQFEIELKFDSETIGEDIKRGMSLPAKLFLSNSNDALLIPKGLFFQNTNGGWVFVLNEANKAVRRNIKLGRENPFYYEVLSGLKNGDQVITSGYDDFETMEEINLD